MTRARIGRLDRRSLPYQPLLRFRNNHARERRSASSAPRGREKGAGRPFIRRRGSLNLQRCSGTGEPHVTRAARRRRHGRRADTHRSGGCAAPKPPKVSAARAGSAAPRPRRHFPTRGLPSFIHHRLSERPPTLSSTGVFKSFHSRTRGLYVPIPGQLRVAPRKINYTRRKRIVSCHS